MDRRSSFPVATLCVLLVLLHLGLGEDATAAVSAVRGKVHLPVAEFVDADAVYLENDLVKLSIDSQAGRVMTLLYKPTGHELGSFVDSQGYFRDRMGDGGFWGPGKRTGATLEIVSQDEEKAVASFSYVWHRENTDVRLTKDFTLKRDEAVLYCTWTFENLGQAETSFTPWIKHVGGIGYEDNPVLLASPVVMQEDGLASAGKPVTNWSVRRSSAEKNTAKLPMVAAVFTFEDVTQYYNWAGNRKPDDHDRRFTLEAILRNVTLKPGETWQTTNVLAVTPNLCEPLYVAPELAASVSLKPAAPRAGEPVELTLHIAPSSNLGPRRLEGDIAVFGGDERIALPNREVELQADRITDVTYAFTPPQEGVYTLNIGVFDGQPLQRLGVAVNSQRNSITAPVVIGPRPEVIVEAWKTSGSFWKTREGRTLAVHRTLLKSDGLRAGQILVPERIFPEDTLTYGETIHPAHLRLAANQHESFQFVVEVGEDADIMEVEVAVSAFTDEAGNKLDKVRLLEPIYLTTTTPSKYNASFPVGHFPDPLFQPGWHKLIPEAPITQRNLEIKRGCRRRLFWVTLKTPADAAPGLYTAEVTLSLAGEQVAAFPVRARISDFSLPTRPSYNPSTGMVGWGSKKTVENFGLTKEQAEALPPSYWGKYGIDAYRRLVLEYGWSPTMWTGLDMWKEFQDYGRGMTVFCVGGGKQKERGSETSKWLKENDLMQYAFAYAPFDEHTNAEVPAFVEWAKEYRKKSDVPIGDCYYGDRIDPMIDLVDVWIGQYPKAEHWGEPTGPYGWGRKAVEAKKRGVKFYAVNASLIWFLELDPVQGRGQFWDDFTVGYDGRYVYSTCRQTPELYKENYTGGQGNYLGCVAYISPRGITTGIRMETLRDGVYDYDYLTLLKQGIAAAKASGKADALAAEIKEAEGILHDPELRARVRTVEKLHAMRARIADLIEALKQ